VRRVGADFAHRALEGFGAAEAGLGALDLESADGEAGGDIVAHRPVGGEQGAGAGVYNWKRIDDAMEERFGDKRGLDESW